jgi:hypothetical protein
MIKTALEMRQALKSKAGRKPQFAGIVLYEGASLIDGAPIVVIVNKIMAKSANAKTGHMVQSFIIRSDMHPVEALQNGQDESVCGKCRHRPFLAGTVIDNHGTIADGACYVQVSKSVASVYQAYRNDRYARPGIDFDPAILPELFEGLAFRLGTYGDPAAAPFQVWRRATLKTAMHNGYSHQWRDPRFQAFKLLCMASADTESERDEAHEMGWRTFRVRGDDKPLVKGLEIICPASKEADYKTNCASCKACGGLSAKAKVSIAIMAHGIFAKRVAA